MMMIEVLLTDGSVRVHATVEQVNETIDEEVARLYPDASHWRPSREWRSVIGDVQPKSVMSVTWARAKPVAIVLVLAVILTPVMTWVTSLHSDVAVWSQIKGESSAATVEGGGAVVDPAAGPVSAAQDVHIVGMDGQPSDTSLTLQLRLLNTGAKTYHDVRVRAVFYDKFDTLLPEADGSVGKVTLAPGEEGYAKVWARSDYGVGKFELEVLDPEP